MRVLAMVLGLTLSAGVALAEECREKQKFDFKVICFDDPAEVTGTPLPPAFVITRSQEAKKAVDAAGDHLDAAARRGR